MSASGARIAQIERQLGSVKGIAAVSGPAETGLVSRGGDQALITGTLSPEASEPSDVGARVTDAFSGVGDVTAGGPAVAASQLDDATLHDLERIELIAFPLLFLCSLLAFRGLVAALLPLAVGTFSVTLTLFVLRLLTGLLDVDSFAINIVTALGWSCSAPRRLQWAWPPSAFSRSGSFTRSASAARSWR